LLNPAHVNLNDQELAYRLGTAAWHKYRHTSIAERRPGILRLFERLVDDLPRFASRGLDASDLLPVEQIYAIAVWDTVGAMGIPRYDEKDTRIDSFQFADNTLHAKVKHAFHAVSVDEKRPDFVPTLWEGAREGMKQVLFPGAHADVGGGYSAKANECGLSDVALDWMIRELKTIGVRFSEKQPIPVARDHAGCEHTPWEFGIFKAFGSNVRQLPPNLLLHESVMKRWQAGEVPIQGGRKSAYRPKNLEKYIDANGVPHPGVNIVHFD
jgi:glutathione S-transferase